MMPSFQVQTDDLPDGVMVIEVRLLQLLDEQAEDLRRDLVALIKQHKPRLAILDLKRVTVISSLGVGVVISLLKRVREQGGDLVMCGLAPMVEEVFHLCQLLARDEKGSGVRVFRTVEAALAGAGPAS